MKTITQREIAKYVGVSDVFIHEVRKGSKGFSKKSANDLSERTSVSFEFLALASGEELYQALVLSYQQQQGVLK